MALLSIPPAVAQTPSIPYVSHVPLTIQEQVKSDIVLEASKLGVDERLALAICRCESHLDPYATGTLAIVGKDYGPCQVNSYYHAEEMAKQGLNIYDWHDSTHFALKMMASGTEPWNASRSCWEK